MTLFEREDNDFGSDVGTRALSVTAVENEFVERVYQKLSKVYDLVYGPTLHPGRLAAAAGGALVLAGEVALRWSVFKAGFQSARDPKYTVLPQRERLVSDTRTNV